MRLSVSVDPENHTENEHGGSFPSVPTQAAKDYHAGDNARRHLKNSRPPAKPLAPKGGAPLAPRAEQSWDRALPRRVVQSRIRADDRWNECYGRIPGPGLLRHINQ